MTTEGERGGSDESRSNDSLSPAESTRIDSDVGDIIEPDDDIAMALVHDLVATPSVSGWERDAVECLARWMQRLGYRASIDAAGNAVGEIGSNSPDATEIVLLGHIDTVPGDIDVRIENGWLHGRGSVDAKGPLATFVVAGARAVDELPDDVRLVVVGAVGEEAPDSPGATYVRDQHRPAACIIGEPSTWRRCTIGYKGRLLVEATFEQDCGHSAGPDRTPAESAVDWWLAVQRTVDQLNSGRDGIFDTLQSNLQRINTSSNGMVERASALAGFRLPVWIETGELEAAVQAVEDELDERPDSCRAYGDLPAVRVARTSAVAKALTAAIADEGERPAAVVKTGTSDMNTVAGAWSCPIAAYGPGDSSLDHTPHERLELDEYRRAIRVLAAALPMLAEDVRKT